MGATNEGCIDQKNAEKLQDIYEKLVTAGKTDEHPIMRPHYVEMVAKLCFANSHVKRLHRLREELERSIADGAWICETLALCAEGKHKEAYDKFEQHYGRLLYVMGQFESVNHRLILTHQFDALVGPLVKELQRLVGTDGEIRRALEFGKTAERGPR